MKTKLITALIFGITLLISCQSNQAPKCSGITDDLKIRVMEKIKSQLYSIYGIATDNNNAGSFNLNEIVSQINSTVNEKMAQMGHTTDLVEPNTDMETYIKAINYTDAYNEGKQLQEGYNKWKKEIEDRQQPIRDKYNSDLASIRLSVISSILNDLSVAFHFESIRPTRKDDNIKKCNCEADLYSNNDKIRTLKYSAQFTEDGKIYIVYDLN